MSGLLPLERPQGYRDELVEWYNGDRHRMSLDEGKTPAEAFVRKMPPPQAKSNRRARSASSTRRDMG